VRKLAHLGALALGCIGIGFAPAPACGQTPNPDKEAYFGEEHIHTSWSVDAWVIGNRLTGPDDALKYAQGQTIKHPAGYDIKIDTPMDFMGVTDHSEYVGVTKQANTPGSDISKMPEAQPLILHNPNDPAVGSSSTITGGLCTSACATSTRRFMPPDKWRMFVSALAVRSRCVMISSIQSSLRRKPK